LTPARKAWRFLCLLLRPALAQKLGTLVTEGYLARTGWVRSANTGTVVDHSGEPWPWMTLPFVDFIIPRLRSNWTVFEYGAGASTRFFAARVGSVLAVEHDEVFAGRLRSFLPENARLLVRSLNSSAYVDAVTECSPPPTMICVDGRDRVRCVIAALPVVAREGVIVLDDAERTEYAPAAQALAAAGFRSAEFWGIALGRVERKCTTIFYRDGNALGL
jgi:hypothetical protein